MPNNKFNHQITDLTQKRQLLVVLIFFFVVIILWTFSSLIASQQKTTISKDLVELSQPLNPILNENVIKRLEDKRHFSDQELQAFKIYKLISSDDKKTIRLVEISSEVNSLDGIEDSSELRNTPTLPVNFETESNQLDSNVLDNNLSNPQENINNEI